MLPPTNLDDPEKLDGEKLVEKAEGAYKSGRGDLLLAYATPLLKKFRKILGNQIWELLERVYISAVEYRQDSWAQFCALEMRKKWGKTGNLITAGTPLQQNCTSSRIQRITAMAREAIGDYSQAMKVYTNILIQMPHDLISRKRICSLLKTQRKYKECIQMLCTHLDEYHNDVESWHELGEIYLLLGFFSQALFCFEECLLSDPLNTYYVITIAEIHGTMKNFELSRKYFCSALRIDPNNVRSIWGLVLSSVDIVSSEKKQHCPHSGASSVDETSTFRQLLSIAFKKLENMYLMEINNERWMDACFASATLTQVRLYRNFLDKKALT